MPELDRKPERQAALQKANCWEVMECGREPGGLTAGESGVCPAATDAALDGRNAGLNGGRLCWVAAGTFCGGAAQGSFAHKITACVECAFFLRVREEEPEFQFLLPGREYEEVFHLLEYAQAQRSEIEAALRTVERQQQAIRALSTPILEVWDDVLVVPLIGVLDGPRREELLTDLLGAITTTHAAHVIIDVTGVELVDTDSAGHLLYVAKAARLLGAHCVLTGLSPAIAQSLTMIGVDLSTLTPLRNLKAGLMACMRARPRSGKVAR